MTNPTVSTKRAELFWAKVTKQPSCWTWNAGKDTKGYGVFWTGESVARAHRWAYEHLIGPIPDGLVLDHLCRNHACVNPDHLEPVEDRTNILRGVGRGAIHARKTHCPHGHPYTPENTKIVNGRWRKCRTCLRARSRTTDPTKMRPSKRAAPLVDGAA